MYIVEIVLPRNDVAIRSHQEYPLEAFLTKEYTDCCTKKYRIANPADVVSIQLDVKRGKLIGTIVHISNNGKVLVNATQSLPIDETKNNDNNYPTDEGYAMEDYSSLDDE